MRGVSRTRVLVVDDFGETAEVACTLLGLRGHLAYGAATAAQALDVARRIDPEVAIIDIGLPDMSGFDLCSQLRAEFRNKDLYLVALTGWEGPGDIERARRAGFDRYVLKPVTLGALSQIVTAAALRKRPPQRDPAPTTRQAADADLPALVLDPGPRDR